MLTLTLTPNNRIIVNGPCVIELPEDCRRTKLRFAAPRSTFITRNSTPEGQILDFQIRTAIQEECNAPTAKAS